jgi:hypothetical protein
VLASCNLQLCCKDVRVYTLSSVRVGGPCARLRCLKPGYVWPEVMGQVPCLRAWALCRAASARVHHSE